MEYLIPPEWFHATEALPSPFADLALIAIAAVATYALVRGADWLVEGASGTAYRIGISKVIVGATVVSLGTTSPEAAVSVMAAWRGDAGLALGNAVGSIIADTGLIFGIGCLMCTLPADKFVLSRQGWVQIGSAVMLAALCYVAFALDGDGAVIGRWAGWMFLALLVAYMFVSVKWSKAHREGEPFQIHEDDHIEASGKRSWLQLIGFSILGLALVLVFSHVLIEAVKVLAERWGVPQVVIASTIVALGTSLPELVVGITAIRKKHPELLVGNVIGADILNVLFVVGASAAAADLPVIDAKARVQAIFLLLHLPTMLIILGLFRVFIFKAVRTGHFSRWMGWPLVLIYVAFIVVSFAVS